MQVSKLCSKKADFFLGGASEDTGGVESKGCSHELRKLVDEDHVMGEKLVLGI